MREKRTSADFSQHIVTEIKFPDILITKFAKPDTYCCSITFINTQGVLAITGDYGNWIFCREFHPSADGFVSDSYWCEKLRIASTQKIADYDPEETRKEIERRLKDDDKDLSQEERDYLNDLFNYVDECEERYLVYAYDNLPKHLDHEYIPIEKKLNPWLDVIFDAFDEICRRKAKEKENVCVS